MNVLTVNNTTAPPSEHKKAAREGGGDGLLDAQLLFQRGLESLGEVDPGLFRQIVQIAGNATQ